MIGRQGSSRHECLRGLRSRSAVHRLVDRLRVRCEPDTGRAGPAWRATLLPCAGHRCGANCAATARSMCACGSGVHAVLEPDEEVVDELGPLRRPQQLDRPLAIEAHDPPDHPALRLVYAAENLSCLGERRCGSVVSHRRQLARAAVTAVACSLSRRRRAVQLCRWRVACGAG